MSEQAASPFARLDTSLLRSTKPPVAAPPAAEPESPPAPAAERTQVSARRTRARDRQPEAAIVTPRHRDTVVDTTTPRHRDTVVVDDHDAIIDSIRRTVRDPGKEAATLRLTTAEKERLGDIVYTYNRRRQGRRTSETELIRIATNFLLEDYERHGEGSVLAHVIAALDS